MKQDILRNIIAKFENVIDDISQNDGRKNNSVKSKVQHLCGVHAYFIYQATKLARVQNQKLSLKCWLNALSFQEEQPHYLQPTDAEILKLRKRFVEAYLLQRIIPVEDVFNEFISSNNPTPPIPKFSRLQMNGYTLCRLPKTRKGILIEKTPRLAERMLYLKKITQYRDEGRKILYLEERITFKRVIMEDKYESQSACNHCIILLNEDGIVVNFSIVCRSSHVGAAKFLHDFVESNVDRLPPNSVVVLRDKAHHKQNAMPLPTQFSSKKQMTDWLQYNEIEHDAEWHRAELYKLIEVNRRNCKVEYNVDYLFKSRSHDVLRCPHHCQFLNHFHDFWNKVHHYMFEKSMRLQLSFVLKESINQAGELFTPYIWKEKENNMILDEHRMLKEDLQVEEIIDCLCIMMKYGDSDKNHEEIVDLDLDYPSTEKDYYFSKLVASSLDETEHYLIRPY